MTQKEFEAVLAGSLGVAKRCAGEIVAEFRGALDRALKKGEAVSIRGLGTFKVVKREAKRGRNPRTGEVIEIPAHEVVKFTPSKSLGK